MEQNDALTIVFAKNSFYKRMHYLALAAFALACVVIIILTIILIHIYRYPTMPLYFATDEVGRLIPVIPTDKPNMSEQDATTWAENAVVAAFSYDFINFRRQLQSAQRYFTDYGWRTYMNALNASNNLVAVDQRRMVLLAQIVGTPKLTGSGLLSGTYAYRFEMQMLITNMIPPYDNTSNFTNPLTVAVIVQRQPILQSYKGLGIVQVIANFAIAPGPQQQQQPLTAAAPNPSQ